MQDNLQDKCGIIGVYSRKKTDNVANFLYYGLYSLQHRGQESAGMSIFNNEKIETYTGMGLVVDVFNDETLKNLQGHIGIGHVRYSTTGESKEINCSPFAKNFSDGTISVAHNGDIINSKELKEELIKDGYKFNSTTDSEIICDLFIQEHKKCKDNIKAIQKIAQKLIGSYSLSILINDDLIVLRDPLGMKPLSIAYDGDYVMVASESVAFDTLNLEYDRSIKPGEILLINDKGFKSYFIPGSGKKEANCIFEYIYFARPDSIIYDKRVYDIRLAIGKALAKEHPIDADVVMPVPDSAIPAAIAYSRESKIGYGEGLIKNRYVGRTFIMPGQEKRETAVRLKMNTVEPEIKGKKIVLIDDSVVRGTTSKEIIKIMRQAGAKEVHLRIGCPPIISPCYYGIAMASKKELIAVNKTIPEIAKTIGVDSIEYLSLDALVEAIGTPKEKLCDGCLTENYPTKIPDDN